MITDITFCVNEGCPMRSSCLRNPWFWSTGKQEDEGVSNAHFEPRDDNTCDYYIDDRTLDERNSRG